MGTFLPVESGRFRCDVTCLVLSYSWFFPQLYGSKYEGKNGVCQVKYIIPFPLPAAVPAHARECRSRWFSFVRHTVGVAHVRPAGHVPGGCSPWRAPTCARHGAVPAHARECRFRRFSFAHQHRRGRTCATRGPCARRVLAMASPYVRQAWRCSGTRT